MSLSLVKRNDRASFPCTPRLRCPHTALPSEPSAPVDSLPHDLAQLGDHPATHRATAPAPAGFYASYVAPFHTWLWFSCKKSSPRRGARGLLAVSQLQLGPAMLLTSRPFPFEGFERLWQPEAAKWALSWKVFVVVSTVTLLAHGYAVVYITFLQSRMRQWGNGAMGLGGYS